MAQMAAGFQGKMLIQRQANGRIGEEDFSITLNAGKVTEVIDQQIAA